MRLKIASKILVSWLPYDFLKRIIDFEIELLFDTGKSDSTPHKLQDVCVWRRWGGERGSGWKMGSEGRMGGFWRMWGVYGLERQLNKIISIIREKQPCHFSPINYLMFKAAK